MADAVNYITEHDAYEKVQPLWSIRHLVEINYALPETLVETKHVEHLYV
jgi:hypothetical protein